MAEKYLVSYFSSFEGGMSFSNSVVTQKCLLTTGEQIAGLVNFLTEKVGRPVAIISLYHMCTVIPPNKSEKEVCRTDATRSFTHKRPEPDTMPPFERPQSSSGGWLDTNWMDGILSGCEDRCSACGRSTVGEVCQQCGRPLCSICVETRAGFCIDCPTEDYKPEEED